jgi:hypothetical protein
MSMAVTKQPSLKCIHHSLDIAVTIWLSRYDRLLIISNVALWNITSANTAQLRTTEHHQGSSVVVESNTTVEV